MQSFFTLTLLLLSQITFRVLATPTAVPQTSATISLRDDDAKVSVLGTWSLVSLNLVTNATLGSKVIAQPDGPTPLGRININPDGFLSVLLTNPSLAIPLPVAWQQGNDSAVANVARAMTAYCGPYTISTDLFGNTQLTTNVEVALDPSMIGVPQVRNVTLTGKAGNETLVLTPPQPFLFVSSNT
jgi:hypothetical protein